MAVSHRLRDERVGLHERTGRAGRRRHMDRGSNLAVSRAVATRDRAMLDFVGPLGGSVSGAAANWLRDTRTWPAYHLGLHERVSRPAEVVSPTV